MRLRTLGVLTGAGALTLGLACAAPAAASDLAAFGATKVCTFADDRLHEISGMAVSASHPGILWALNDSGGGPYVYALDAHTCHVRARVQVRGASARDFEAMAVGRDGKGRPVLWLADIGDNLASWPHVQLVRIREPERIADATVAARTFDVRYPDGPHDAETLLADPVSGRLWIVTKQLADGRLYSLPRHLSSSSITTARFVRTERGLITDGAISPDGHRYALRDYVDATVFSGLPPGTQPRIVQLPYQPQGEALAWTADGTALLVASEKDRRLLRVPVDRVPPPSSPTPASSSSSSSSSGPAGPAAPVATSGPSALPEPASPEPSSALPASALPASALPSAAEPGPGPSAWLPAAVAVLLVSCAAAVIGVVELRRRTGRPGGGRGA